MASTMPAIPAAAGPAADSQPAHLTTDLARASFLRHLRAGNKSPRTIETYLDAVDWSCPAFVDSSALGSWVI
jgi:hypothetical protein